MTETTTNPAAALLTSLRALEEDQIAAFRLEVMTLLSSHASLHRLGPLEVISDPLARFHLDLAYLLDGEVSRRGNVLRALEADLAGGHLVEIGLGSDDPHKFAGYCDPRPMEDEYCWIGPDRATIEQAVADAREHSGGAEPRLMSWLEAE